MKLQLLIAGQYPSCLETRDIWQQACNQNEVALEIINLEDDQGQALMEALAIKSFPVLIVDGKIKVVGRPDVASAHQIIGQLTREE